MLHKSGNAFLDTLDFIANKITPKKFIVMLITCLITYLLKDAIPPAFYYVVGVYIGGSTVVSSIKKRGGGDGP